jgi:hypothetical protein
MRGNQMSTQPSLAIQTEWWQVPEVQPEVQACLDKLNESQRDNDPVSRFSHAMQALNVLWNGKNRLEQLGGRSDNQSFRDLLRSIPVPRQEQLCDCQEMRTLATFTPQVLNVDCLRASRTYIPGHPIPPELQNQATREHRQLGSAFENWEGAKIEESRIEVLKKFAVLLYVVRSNIAHGEKTASGPDLAKTQRDTQVCELSLPAVNAAVEIIFAHPSQKLISYGTLSPSEPNNSVLDPIKEQSWEDCQIEGVIREANGLKSFEWRMSSLKIPAKLLTSPSLLQHWVMLDRFEGKQYLRTFATAEVGNAIVVARVYHRA